MSCCGGVPEFLRWIFRRVTCGDNGTDDRLSTSSTPPLWPSRQITAEDGCYEGRVHFPSLGSTANVLTPRHKAIKDRLSQSLTSLYPNDRRKCRLIKEFVLDLLRGSYLTQLNSQFSFDVLYTTVDDSFTTLMFDQPGGQRIEFPLRDFKLVYNIQKILPRYGKFEPFPYHLCVAELPFRKLAFVFEREEDAHKFTTGLIGLLTVAR